MLNEIFGKDGYGDMLAEKPEDKLDCSDEDMEFADDYTEMVEDQQFRWGEYGR